MHSRTMEILFTAENNHTLLGTLLLRPRAGLTPPPASTTPGPAYDGRGATLYAVAVIMLYSFSIVLLIASHTYMTRKSRQRGGDEDMTVVTKYLEQVPRLQELSRKDSFRRLKMSLMPMLSIAIAPGLMPDGSACPALAGGGATADPERRVRVDMAGVHGEALPGTAPGDGPDNIGVRADFEGEDVAGASVPLGGAGAGTVRHIRMLSSSGDTARSPSSCNITNTANSHPCLRPQDSSLSSRVAYASFTEFAISPPTEKLWLESEVPIHSTRPTGPLAKANVNTQPRTRAPSLSAVPLSPVPPSGGQRPNLLVHVPLRAVAFMATSQQVSPSDVGDRRLLLGGGRGAVVQFRDAVSGDVEDARAAEAQALLVPLQITTV